MWTLGLSMEYDASAALAKDGRLVAAISEERLSRKKGHWGYPWRAASECLRIAGIRREDIDVFSVSLNKFPACYFRKPGWFEEWNERWHRTRRRIKGRPEEVTVTMSHFLREVRSRGLVLSDLFNWVRFRDDGFVKAKVRFVDHHYAHAHSAIHFSGFDEALVMTVDCVGDCCVQDEMEAHTPESIFLQNLVPLSHTTSLWQEGRLRRLCVTDLNGSPGSFYGSVTEALGFISPRHEGKVTGLAAWGKDPSLDAPFRKTFRLSDDRTHFVSDQIWHGSGNISEARKAVIRKSMQGHSRENVSGSAQRILEEAIVGHAQWALRKTGMRALAVSGGVFGNVKLNQRLMELPEVNRLFVFPAMSDAGLAVAAAQIAAESSKLKVSSSRMEHVYLGPEYGSETIEKILKEAELQLGRGVATINVPQNRIVGRHMIKPDGIHAHFLQQTEIPLLFFVRILVIVPVEVQP